MSHAGDRHSLRQARAVQGFLRPTDAPGTKRKLPEAAAGKEGEEAAADGPAPLDGALADFQAQHPHEGSPARPHQPKGTLHPQVANPAGSSPPYRQAPQGTERLPGSKQVQLQAQPGSLHAEITRLLGSQPHPSPGRASASHQMSPTVAALVHEGSRDWPLDSGPATSPRATLPQPAAPAVPAACMIMPSPSRHDIRQKALASRRSASLSKGRGMHEALTRASLAADDQMPLLFGPGEDSNGNACQLADLGVMPRKKKAANGWPQVPSGWLQQGRGAAAQTSLGGSFRRKDGATADTSPLLDPGSPFAGGAGRFLADDSGAHLVQPTVPPAETDSACMGVDMQDSLQRLSSSEAQQQLDTSDGLGRQEVSVHQAPYTADPMSAGLDKQEASVEFASHKGVVPGSSEPDSEFPGRKPWTLDAHDPLSRASLGQPPAARASSSNPPAGLPDAKVDGASQGCALSGVGHNFFRKRPDHIGPLRQDPSPTDPKHAPKPNDGAPHRDPLQPTWPLASNLDPLGPAMLPQSGPLGRPQDPQFGGASGVSRQDSDPQYRCDDATRAARDGWIAQTHRRAPNVPSSQLMARRSSPQATSAANADPSGQGPPHSSGNFKRAVDRMLRSVSITDQPANPAMALPSAQKQQHTSSSSSSAMMGKGDRHALKPEDDANLSQGPAAQDPGEHAGQPDLIAPSLLPGADAPTASQSPPDGADQDQLGTEKALTRSSSVKTHAEPPAEQASVELGSATASTAAPRTPGLARAELAPEELIPGKMQTPCRPYEPPCCCSLRSRCHHIPCPPPPPPAPSPPRITHRHTCVRRLFQN